MADTFHNNRLFELKLFKPIFDAVIVECVWGLYFINLGLI